MKVTGTCFCGGSIVRDYGGINPSYHCLKCGIVTKSAGKPIEPKTLSVICAIDNTYKIMGNKSIKLDLLLSAAKSIFGQFDITDNELKRAGYKIKGKRVKYIRR